MAPVVNSEQLSSHWLPAPSLEHLLVEHGALGRGKSAALDDCTATLYRRQAANVESEEVGLNSSRQRHLLINLQERLHRTFTGTTFTPKCVLSPAL